MPRNYEKELWVKVYLESLKSGKSAKQSKDLAKSSVQYFADCFGEFENPKLENQESPRSTIHFSNDGLTAYVPSGSIISKYYVPEPFSYDFSRWTFAEISSTF